MKRHRFALAFIALVAAPIFIAPLLKQEVFTLRDHLDYFQPLRWFTAQELRAGHLPQWNPYNASGEPWLANPQTNVFYPPAWIFLVLPFATAYMLFLLFHLVVLGWGAYLLFARSAAPGAAMFGAVALMLSGPVLSLLDVNNNLAAFAWIPLALWCAAECAPIRGGFFLALVFLAGEPFLAGVAALLYVIVGLVGPRGPIRPIGPIRHVLLAALIAFGTSAIQLLPFLEMLRGSDRAAGLAEDVVLRNSMPLSDWLCIVIWTPKLGQQFIPVIYVGAIVVALAVLGIRKRSIGWLALLIVAALIASGPSWLAQLPLTLFRYPARLVPFGAFALAALATIGWDRVRRDKRWLDLLLILVVVADLLRQARPLLHSEPFRRDLVPYAKSIGADSKFIRVGDIDPARRAAWIAGYLNLYDRRFDAFTAAPVMNDHYLRFYRRVFERPTPIVLGALPAGYLVSSLALSFERIARAENVTVYRNASARSMAIVMTPHGITPARWEIGTSHERVIADAPEDGVLVLAQQDAPPWRVRVDGKNAKKRRIFGLFLGVDVPKGHHEVVFSYRSRALFLGAAMTLVTLLALQIFFFVKRHR
jgi:hypothetical protein